MVDGRIFETSHLKSKIAKLNFGQPDTVKRAVRLGQSRAYGSDALKVCDAANGEGVPGGSGC